MINVELGFSGPLVTRLLRSELDFVVGRIPDWDNAAHLNFEPIADEQFVLVAATNHALRSSYQAVDYADLVKFGWIIQGERGMLRGRLNAALHSKGLPPPTNIVETSSLSISLALLQAGDMVAVLPKLPALPFCRAGLAKILPFDLGIKTDAFGIITRREYPLCSGAQVLLEEVRRTSARLHPIHEVRLESMLAV
jgi:DNA-binding transcriptional LysR family regulator